MSPISTVSAVDSHGLPCQLLRLCLQVNDLGTGEYVSSFSAAKAATYQVTVTHGNTNIAGSPFSAVVVPADIAASASYAMGEGLQNAVCGQKVRTCQSITAYSMKLPMAHP